MSKVFTNKYLIPYWISFPEDMNYPIGFGVTAFTIEEAFSLLEEFGFEYHRTAKQVQVMENIKWNEMPYAAEVHPNMGPIIVRGVWYPHFNSR